MVWYGLGLQKALEKSEEDSKRLLTENTTYVQKLIQMKEEQAKEMNVVNDMYLMLQKAAKNNAEMMKQLGTHHYHHIPAPM